MAFKVDLDGLNRLQDRLDRIVDPDITPLLDDIAEIVVEGNREGLLSGIAADGGDMPTPQRSAGGPYLVPRRSQSRAISEFEAEVKSTAGGWKVIGEWRDAPFMKYYGDLVYGIRPETMDQIEQKVVDFWSDLIDR